jgi:hypothetical protein
MEAEGVVSTYWDIYCRTCDDLAGFHVRDASHLAALLKRLDEWAAMAGLAGANTDIVLRLPFDEANGIHHFPAFATRHYGHKEHIVIRNEYGEFLGRETCSHRIKCLHCDRWMECALLNNHAGEHHLMRE